MRHFNTAPAPWGQTRYNIPDYFRTIPSEQLRTRNWPVYPEQMLFALTNRDAASVPIGTFFLPLAAATHPYSGAIGAVRAVRESQTNLAQLSDGVMRRALNGQTLSSQEARAVKRAAAAMPAQTDEISFNAAKQVAAQNLGVNYGARGIPFVPVPASPPMAVLRLLNAARRGSLIDPTGLLSTAAQRMASASDALRASIYSRVGRPGIPQR